MSIDEYISQLGKQIQEVVINQPLYKASLTTHQQASRRIFTQSLDVNQGEITYKKPTKNKRKGAYSRRYALYKENRGRQISKVDFALEGDFRSDYMNSPVAPIKVNNDEYIVEFKRDDSTKLRKIFENDYYIAKIFSLSKQEKEVFHTTARKELIKILK